MRSTSSRAWLVVISFVGAFVGAGPQRAESEGAKGRRALVVGINLYRPRADADPSSPTPRWIDLDGAVNDALGMKALLMARFGFAEADIELLTDRAATRAAILAGFDRLAARSRPGDVAVFFYAGHGSRVRNSLSSERDRMDETIVPADSYLGAEDIRDKELNEKLNQLLDEQAVVTAIFDSCHSGSISRGPHRKSRDAPPAEARDVKDGRKLADPASRGALILSAAQDYQSASEDEEVVDGTSVPHGAFSLALFRVLRASRGDEPAERIALSVRAMLQSNGGAQEPALEGATERRRGPLFGTGALAGSDVLTIPVLRILDQSRLELQGGPALGIAKGSVLSAERPAAGQRPMRVEITDVLGMARARARVLEGTTAGLRPGLDRFVVTHWVPVTGAPLQLFAPAVEPDVLRALEPELRALAAAPEIEWVLDPASHPTHIVSFSGTTWRLLASDAPPVDLGRRLTSAAVIGGLPSGSRARLWLAVPVSVELRKNVEKALGQRQAAVALVSEPDRAQYMLVARPAGGASPAPPAVTDPLEYALVQSDLTLPCKTRTGGDDACRPGGSLPPLTRWVAGSDAPRDLTELAQRLAKIRGWLSIDASAPRDFPYALALRAEHGGPVLATGTLHDGERYDVLLQAAPADIARPVRPRFVYVFALSNDGASTLIFPSSGSCDVEARLPVLTGASGNPPEIRLGTIRVSPPFGQDTYLMLSTEEALPNCTLLDSAGVTTQRGASRGKSTPLELLLEGVSAGRTRGTTMVTPDTWSIERIVFTSVARP